MNRSVLAIFLAACAPSLGPTPDAPGPTPDAPAPPGEPVYRRLAAPFQAPVGTAYLDVFLPEGTAPGGRVLVRRDGWPSLHAEATLDARQRATLEGVFCDGCTFVLDVAEPCATAAFSSSHVSRAPGADTGVLVTGSLEVCDVAAAAPVDVVLTPDVSIDALGPFVDFRVSGVPIDVATTVGGAITIGGRTIVMGYDGDGWGGTFTILSPVDPVGPVSVELPVIRTVFGDEATVTIATPLATTATITDLSFETAPAPGSFAAFGYELLHEDGHVLVRDEGRWPRRSAFAAILALGDPGVATSVRVSATAASRFTSSTSIALYRSGGGRSATETLRGADVTLTMPDGAGALWLLVANPQNLSQPSDVSDPVVFSIDEIVLE